VSTAVVGPDSSGNYCGQTTHTGVCAILDGPVDTNGTCYERGSAFPTCPSNNQEVGPFCLMWTGDNYYCTALWLPE
jgi:hypothetical protein